MKKHDKSFSYTPLAIALALGTATQAVYAAPPSCSTSGSTTTCNGTSGTYNDSIVETGGNPTSVHNLVVNNVDIANFTAGANYTGLAYKSGISLAGNNATPVPHSALGSLTVTVNGGSITGTSTGYLSGIYTRSDSDNADVTVNTNTHINISSSTAPLYGILTEHFAGANGSANVVLNNGSNITISGSGAASGAGVRIASTGADGLASLTANGTVSVSTIGDNLHGYSVGASGANGDAIIDLSNATSSTVSTNGLNSVGILATSSSGNATINAKGSVSSLNTGTAISGSTYAHGIYAQSSGGAGTTAKVTYGDGTVTVKGSGVDTGEDTIAGILAKALGNGDAAITVNSGSVVMDGGSHTVALGAYTNGTGNVLVDFLGGSILTSQNGAGTATDTDGIHAHARGTGDVIVNSYGNITTSGTDISEGIIAVATGGNVTVDAKGNINTTGLGDRNKGILVQTTVAGKTAKVTYNDATGSISTVGTNSHAIEVNSGAGDAIIDVKAAQLIKTTGKNAYALYAHATGTGTVDITNYGNLETTGQNASAIYGMSTDGKVTIINHGDITTTASAGSYSDHTGNNGIYARATGTGAIDITSNGNINATGLSYSKGINAYTNSGNISINASGNISASASSSTGDNDAISAETTSGAIEVIYDDANGVLSTQSASGDGIQVVSSTAGTGQIDVKIKAAKEINVKGNNSQGIFIGNITTGGSGNVFVENHATLMNIGTSSSTGNNGISVNTSGSGNITIDSTSDMIIHSLSGSPAIQAIALAGDIDVTVGGYIQSIGGAALSTANNHGIFTSTTTGNILTKLAATGSISTVGGNSDGIRSISNSGDNHVISLGKITTADARGIVAWNNSGNATIDATNDVTTGRVTASNHNHGIEAGTSGSGKASVNYDNGTVKVVGTASGGNSIGIVAWDRGSNATSVDGQIYLGSNAIVDASQGVGGIQMRISGTGVIDIAQGAQVHGGTGYGVNLYGVGSTANHTLNNFGTIDSMNDRAISTNLVGGNELIDNYGNITGFITTSSGANVTFNNWSPNSFDIRNFADTDGDGVRDTKAVAVSTFGGSGSTFVNQANGTVRLLAVSGETSVDTTGQWLHDGHTMHSINNSGISQAHMLELGRFENKGVIDLTGAGLPGDVLVISGHSAAGASKANATGVFVTGGSLKIDAVLNKGDEDTQTDLLSVDNVKLGDAPTVIYVNKVGGKGALTNGNGIEIVDVRNHSDADAFVLGNRVVAGPYEYMLYNGSRDYSANSWFLRTNDSNGVPIYRVEVGSYLANQTAATGLFMHTLHDRLGEPQFTEGYKSEGKVSSGWVRIVGTHTDSTAAGGVLDQDTDSYLVHFGGELAQWSNGGNDRLHLGLMGAYGESKTDSSVTYHTPKSITRTSEGKVTGFSTGVYATWYQNAAQPQGLYLDGWLQYGWFDNKVTGQGEPTQSYDSNVLTASIEAGYALVVRDQSQRQWIIEPQAQLAYNSYSADDVVDNYGVKVSGSDADGVVTRLGARMYSRSKLGDNGIQPFVEANWWYGSADNSLEFDGVRVKNDMPENRFELKAGLQGEVTKNWQLWGHIGGQWGENSYKRYEGMVGVKHLF